MTEPEQTEIQSAAAPREATLPPADRKASAAAPQTATARGVLVARTLAVEAESDERAEQYVTGKFG